MATEERVMRLLAESNPIPDVESFDLADVAATRYLAMIDRRSSERTETVERHRNVEPARGHRLTWTAVAAVLVLVVGFAAWTGLSPDRTETAAGVEVADEFARAVTAGETDLSEYVTDGATFGPMPVEIDANLAAFWAGLGTTLTLANCEQTAQVVRCDYESTDRIREVQNLPEFGELTFLIENSKVAAISRSWDQEASGWLDSGDPVIHYLEWLNSTHPGWDSELDWVGDPIAIGGGYAPLAHDDPIRNGRYADALTRYLDEYQQFLEDVGGIRG